MTISQIGFFRVVIFINYFDQCEPILETICYDYNFRQDFFKEKFSVKSLRLLHPAELWEPVARKDKNKF